MYGFTLANFSGQQTVQCGLKPAQPIADLVEAFEFVQRDLNWLHETLNAGIVDPAWGSLRIVAATSVELRLSAHRGDFLLCIADAETGSETTTVVATLAAAFAFVAYWAAANFE